MISPGGLEFFGRAAHVLTCAQWHGIVNALRLSAREAQILLRVFENKKDLAIAMDLGISTHTVHTHLERMYKKLGVQDRCDLLIRVFETYVLVRILETHLQPDAEPQDRR
jgi:DNA-binding CsgD family transcriptional regulator